MSESKSSWVCLFGKHRWIMKKAGEFDIFAEMHPTVQAIQARECLRCGRRDLYDEDKKKFSQWYYLSLEHLVKTAEADSDFVDRIVKKVIEEMEKK